MKMLLKRYLWKTNSSIIEFFIKRRWSEGGRVWVWVSLLVEAGRVWTGIILLYIVWAELIIHSSAKYRQFDDYEII